MSPAANRQRGSEYLRVDLDPCSFRLPLSPATKAPVETQGERQRACGKFLYILSAFDDLNLEKGFRKNVRGSLYLATGWAHTENPAGTYFS